MRLGPSSTTSTVGDGVLRHLDVQQRAIGNREIRGPRRRRVVERRAARRILVLVDRGRRPANQLAGGSTRNELLGGEVGHREDHILDDSVVVDARVCLPLHAQESGLENIDGEGRPGVRGSPDEGGDARLESHDASFEICGRRSGRERRHEDAEDRDEPRERGAPARATSRWPCSGRLPTCERPLVDHRFA